MIKSKEDFFQVNQQSTHKLKQYKLFPECLCFSHSHLKYKRGGKRALMTRSLFFVQLFHVANWWLTADSNWFSSNT